MPNLEERITALEHDRTRLKTIFGLLAALGVGLSLYAKSLSSDISIAENRLDKLNARIDDIEVPDIPGMVDDAIARKVSITLLDGWSVNGVLSQIQAQAICTSISPKGYTVMAILRSPTGKDTTGRLVSEKCSEICPRYETLGTSKTASDLGGVLIYSQSKPFAENNAELFQKGMSTHIFKAGYDNAGFGPNYCCCGG